MAERSVMLMPEQGQMWSSRGFAGVQVVFMALSGMIVDVLEKSGRQFVSSGAVNWDCFRMCFQGEVSVIQFGSYLS